MNTCASSSHKKRAYNTGTTTSDFDRVGLSATASAHAPHAYAHLSAHDAIATTRDAWRPPQPQSDARAVAAGGPLAWRPPAASLRALLAAAGRARRHALLIYEEQAPLTHGCAPPRPHRPQVHARLSVMGRARRASGVEIARSQGGWRGRFWRTRRRLSIAPDTTRMRRPSAGAAGRRSRAPPLEDQEIVGGEDGLTFYVPERGTGGDADHFGVNSIEQVRG